MLFRTHLMLAVFLSLIFFNYLSLSLDLKIIFIIFIILGAIFVDIDSSNSKLGRFWFFRPFQLFFSHRGMIHSLFFCFLFSFIIYLFNKEAGIGFFVGYLSHLFFDIITKEGVCLFWPLSFKKISILKIKVGGILEEIIFVLLLLCNIFIVVKLFF